MLRLAIMCSVIAIIAATFGFRGIATAATDIAQLLFFVFLALFVVFAITNALSGRKPPV